MDLFNLILEVCITGMRFNLKFDYLSALARPRKTTEKLSRRSQLQDFKMCTDFQPAITLSNTRKIAAVLHVRLLYYLKH